MVSPDIRRVLYTIDMCAKKTAAKMTKVVKTENF